MSSAHPPQRGQQGGGGKAPHSMANVLKIYHNKSLQDEAYTKTLKSYDWNAPLPPRGYIFGVGRGAKPLNSSNNGVVVGAGSKSEHGGLSASQLSYFDALDSIEMKQHRARAKAKSGDDADGFQTPAAALNGVDNNNSITNGATTTVKLSLENLASMERTKVAKALKGSLRDDDAGELAEETFFADDAGAEAGLDRLARKRLLGGLMDSTASASVTGTKASASGTVGDATKNTSLSKKSARRLIYTSEQLKEILTTGDESNPATWIRRARAAFDAQELGGGAVVGAGLARSIAESLRILDRGVRKGGRGSPQGPVASQGPHIWREKLFAILKWGHYCEEGDDLDDDEHARDAHTTSALDVMARERRSLISTRCSLKSLDLLKGLQSPSRFKIPVALLGPARETIAEAVAACPSSVELWTYAIALQPTQITASLQSQAALAANPTCVPLYRYTIEQLDTFDDRLALAKAGLERNPFSEEMLVLASSLYEQQRQNPQSLTSARSLFLSAAGRYAREHASRLPPLPIMFEAILLEDRELFGALRPLAKGEGIAPCHDQLDSLKRAEQLGQLSLPWMDLVNVSGARTSKLGGGDPQQHFIQLKHLLAIIGGGQHGISKIVSKTAKIHLIDAVSRRTFEASTAKAAILKEISAREQNAATNAQDNVVVSSLFSKFSLAELKEMLANACSTIAVRGYVVSEWVGLAVEAATRGNVVAGALMLRELLKMQSATPPSSSCAPPASGPAPAEDFSTLSASWCSDFIALCLNRHHGRDSAGRNLRLLASLVESLNTQRAPAVTLQAQELAMRQQEAANKRSHAFVSEILHFQRENTRKEAVNGGDGGRFGTDGPMSTSGPCSGSEYVAIDDGGACDALFGRDGHSSSSSNSASAGVTSNTKALVILMVWVIALIGLSSPSQLACCPTEPSDALEDCKSPTDNAVVDIHVGDLGLPQSITEGSTGSEVKNRDISTSNFDRAVGRATSLRAVAGLIQAFTAEVSSAMAKWEKSREKQKIAEKALAAARRSGNSTALMTSISTRFAPVRMLFSASHRLGKFLELLLNTAHHLSIERSIGAAQRLVYYCGWGYGPHGCPPLLATKALTASSSRSENFNAAAETDNAIGVKREGIANNEKPNVSPSQAIAGGQQQAQLGHTLDAGVVGPWWSDTRAHTEDDGTKLNDKPLLWNSSTLKSIAVVYAQRGGRGFAEGADAAEAFTSGHASSNAESPSHTTSLFDEAVRTVQHIADYSRIISSLFADARRFSESLVTLSHTLALLVRFSYCVPLQNPSELALEEHVLTDTLLSSSLLSCTAPSSDNGLDVKSKAKAIMRLLEARRTLVSTLLMRVSVVPGVESLVLAVCTLLQQSADHQSELYDAASAVADRLHAAVTAVARIRKDAECDNANGLQDAPQPALTVSAEGAEALQPILRSLYGAAQKIAEEERDLIVLSPEGDSSSSAAPVAAVGGSVRAILDSFLLPKIGCERAAGLSSFAERHFSAASNVLISGGSSADSTSSSRQIARNVGLACANDLVKGPAGVSGASSSGESVLIAAAVRASVLPGIPPVLLSVSALLKQARIARSQILTADKANEAAEPKLASSLPILPPHLWSLLKSERLWHHRVVAERYYSKTTDMMSTPIANLLAEVTAASALQEVDEVGRSSRHGESQLRIEDRASRDAADFVYSYSPISCKLRDAHTKISKVLAALAGGADLFESKVPFNTKDALSGLLKALDPTINHCASDAHAYNGVVEQLAKALVIQHQQQQSEGARGAAVQYSLASTVFDAPASVAQLINTAIGSSSAANGGRSVKSRTLWALGAEESVSTAKKRIAIANQCRRVFTVNPQASRSNVNAAQTSHYALELASQMVSQASKTLRAICDDVLKLSSFGGSSGTAPPLPKAVNLALRLSTGPPTGFADIVNLNSKLTSTPPEAMSSPTGGRGLTPLLSVPMRTVVECATAVGCEACRSLGPIESDLYLASNTVALEAFADTLSDQQAARALLDRCEGFVREYMAVVNTKRTEIDRKVEGLESQLAKEVSRETALRNAASGASIEFNKRMLAGAGRGASSSSGSLLTIDHRKSLEEDLLYQRAVKEHITDAIYYRLLRCLFIVLKAKIDLERLTALGGLAKTECLFMNKACLPQNKVDVAASSSDAIAQQQHSLPGAVSSLIPSALHRETLSLIKGIASSTITPHMVELAKSFIRQKSLPADSWAVNNGNHILYTNTFTDYLSQLGLEGLVEVLSLWIEYEVPRERSVAIATVMNRLMSRHPHTYLSVGRMFYSGHKYAKASQEYLKAVDHSHGRSCDAWLSIVFTMRECQRLLKDALKVFIDTVEGRRDTGDAVEDALFRQQHKLTPVLLRAASTSFTSSVEFVAEEMLRPILEQLFGSVSVGEANQNGTAASYSYSELLLPAGYSAVGSSLVTESEGSVAAAACAHSESIVRRVSAAADACAEMAMNMIRDALEAHNSRVLERSGGLNLSLLAAAPVGKRTTTLIIPSDLKSNGTLWSFVVHSSARESESATGVRRPFNELVALALSNFTACSSPSPAH